MGRVEESRVGDTATRKRRMGSESIERIGGSGGGKGGKRKRNQREGGTRMTGEIARMTEVIAPGRSGQMSARERRGRMKATRIDTRPPGGVTGTIDETGRSARTTIGVAMIGLGTVYGAMMTGTRISLHLGGRRAAGKTPHSTSMIPVSHAWPRGAQSVTAITEIAGTMGRHRPIAMGGQRAERRDETEKRRGERGRARAEPRTWPSCLATPCARLQGASLPDTPMRRKRNLHISHLPNCPTTETRTVLRWTNQPSSGSASRELVDQLRPSRLIHPHPCRYLAKRHLRLLPSPPTLPNHHHPHHHVRPPPHLHLARSNVHLHLQPGMPSLHRLHLPHRPHLRKHHHPHLRPLPLDHLFPRWTGTLMAPTIPGWTWARYRPREWWSR